MRPSYNEDLQFINILILKYEEHTLILSENPFTKCTPFARSHRCLLLGGLATLALHIFSTVCLKFKKVLS